MKYYCKKERDDGKEYGYAPHFICYCINEKSKSGLINTKTYILIKFQIKY